MAKTPEQVLREIVAEQIFQIASLVSQVDKLTEELGLKNKELELEKEKNASQQSV